MKICSVVLITCFVFVAMGASAFSMNVVCTTTIVGDIVTQVAGEFIDVFVLLPPDTDPHAFEPRPQDMVMLQRADLVFINGLGLEAGLADILQTLGGAVVSLSESLPGLLFEDKEAHDHSAYDPHVWFNPMLVSEWVDIIADHLSELSPAFESDFRAYAVAYKDELVELDEWIYAMLDQIPAERRKLVTDHHVFGYFERRYEFEQVGTVFPGLSTLSEPSARDIADLISTIESLAIPSIFVGTTVNPSFAQQIATDTGTQVISLYTGALSKSEGPAGTYLDFMRYTVNAIVEGLRRET